jgi:hypothetical protein
MPSVDPGDGDYAIRFGGQYRVVGQATNFERHSTFIGDDQSSVSFGALRIRPWFQLVERDRSDHGFYAQLEIGHLFFGEDGEFSKTSGSEGSQGSVELRRGFLWFEPWEDALLRVGVLDWHDRFGDRPEPYSGLAATDDYNGSRAVLANSVWDFNVSGLTLDGAMSDSAGYRMGLMWLADGDSTLTGDGAALLATSDLDFEAGPHAWGASVYFLRDNGDYSYGTFGGPRAAYESSWDLWTGVRGYLDLGGAAASAYAIVNHGETKNPDWRHTGWAARTALDVDVGEAAVTAQVLYASGNDGSSSSESGEFRTIAQSERDDFGAQGYWSLVGLTSPRGSSDVNDLGVGLQNRGLGLLTAQLAASRPLTTGWTTYVAASWLRSAESNPANGSTDIGFEVLGQVTRQIGSNLALDIGGAWMNTGDFYRDPSKGAPDDLYAVFVRLQLEF